MTTRLVSFLGLGKPAAPPPHYQPVTYHFGAQHSSKTPLVQRALVELLGPVDEIVLLGTEAVEVLWMDSGLLREHLGAEPDAFERVPDGKTPAELHQVFEEVLRALGVEGAVDRPRPRVDRILLDVTHGFRIQPILATSALAFALSEWERAGVDPPDVRVLYGAFEAGSGDEPRPIWDLTEIVTVASWNGALDALVRYGRADGLELLSRTASKRAVERERASGASGAALAGAGGLRKLGEAAQDFADDLALGRLRDLLTRSAPALRERLADSSTERWIGEMPWLRGSVRALREAVEPMCASRVFGPEGILATAAVAEQYERTQRFAELAATMREVLVTVTGHLLGAAPEPDPGPEYSPEARRAGEDDLAELVRAFTTDRESLRVVPQSIESLARLAAVVHPTRNDIEHLGLKRDPAGRDPLRTALVQQRRALSGFLADAVSQPASADSVFVNLSNHPSEAWPALQRAAALRMAGSIVDVAFPDVPPEASAEELDRIVEGVLGRVPEQAMHAMVMGEHTVTTMLVAALQRRGVECLASAGPRRVEELAGGRRVSRFEFVCFRSYPRLG